MTTHGVKSHVGCNGVGGHGGRGGHASELTEHNWLSQSLITRVDTVGTINYAGAGGPGARGYVRVRELIAVQTDFQGKYAL